MTLTDFRKLCANFLTENLSEEEITLFKELLNSSKEFRNEFDQMKNIWESSNPPKDIAEFNIDTNWAKIETDLNLNNTRTNDVKSFTLSKLYWKPATALVAAMVILFITFYVGEATKTIENKTVTVSTQNGEQKTITLSDGSIVTLNSGSSIEYLEKFVNNNREIMLNGEAFFKVQKDPERPFVVSTFNAKTTVLGTEFNVKARESKTEVIVREGLVNLASLNNSDKNVNISYNQKSFITDSNSIIEPKHVNANKMLGWLEGKLVFDQNTLSEITKELKRFYNVEVTLDSDELNNISITGRFDKKDIDTTLTMICLALNLEYDQQNSGYVIKQK